jgi:TrmH family RNA methyltransferase
VTSSLHITSTANPRLKELRRLLRDHRRSGAFVVEGHRQVAAALQAGARVLEVYAARELFLGDRDDALVDLAARRGATIVELGADAFRSVSRAVRPDGLAAIVARWPTALETIRLDAAPLLLVAEGIERPGNLGTIVRSACAAGAAAVVVADGVTDPFRGEVVRGSVGSLFHVPVLEAGSDAVITWLRAHGIRLVVATPAAATAYWSTDYTGATALVIGGERHGVSSCWLEHASETVRIPMPGHGDSLNAAVAAGIVLFEAARQRLVEAAR